MSFSLVVPDLGVLIDSKLTFSHHYRPGVPQLLRSIEGHCSLFDFHCSCLPCSCFCVQPPWLLQFYLRWSPRDSDEEVEAGSPGCGAIHLRGFYFSHQTLKKTVSFYPLSLLP